jgi:alanine racemase
MAGACPSGGRPTWVEVDLEAIRSNVRRFRAQLAPETALMAIVKADGYGHGATPVAQAALAAGAEWLGVAMVEEGLKLRQAGLDAPMLILGQSVKEQMAAAVRAGIDLTIADRESLAEVAAAAERVGGPAFVHLKVDTGMGRLGVWWEAVDEDWISALTRDPRVRWRGIFTHFADSDGDPGYTRLQYQRFLDVLERVRRARALPPLVHLANSAASLQFPGAQGDMVRVGLGLYGLKPYPGAEGLKPALSWYSQVVYLKTVPAQFSVGYGRTYQTPAAMKLATIPVGYADGYRRGWSNRAQVLIRGRRYPVVGRVSMDQIVVAVPISDPVAVGDRVTLLGRDGPEEITAEELAAWIDTISYEVVTGISGRVPRCYRENS